MYRCLVAVAVLVTCVAVPAQAYAVPSTNCTNLSHPHVVGGNNILAGQPGNPDSKRWIRAQGVQGVFHVPENPTVYTGCYGPASGIALKLRFVSGSDNLTSTTMMVGVTWTNHFNPDGDYHAADPIWGVSSGTGGAEGNTWDWEVPHTNPLIGQCLLVAGNDVKLRINYHNDGTWGAYCWNAHDNQWQNMKFGGGTIPNNFVQGIELLSRWRAGSVGGMNLTASSLKYKDFNGNWYDWSNSNCFGNTSSDYFLNGTSTNAFDVYAGTPNANC